MHSFHFNNTLYKECLFDLLKEKKRRLVFNNFQLVDCIS
jgi:hypothetical protein